MSDLDFDFAPLEAPASVVPHAADGSADASSVLASAHAEADAIRAMAHAEGVASGREEALASLAPAAGALEAAARAVHEAAAEASDRLETHAVDLALLVAEKILGAAVAVDPKLVVEAVRGALRGVVERERVIVQVHPDDLDLVRGAMGDLIGSLGGIEHCEVQSERRVTRGGAIVRTPEGDLDARVDTKLQRAREVVESALGAS